MSTTYIPTTNANRALAFARVVSYASSADADPTFVALETTRFSSARLAYSAARAAWIAANNTKKATAEAAAAAEATFLADLRFFVSTVRDSEGHLQSRIVSNLLGGKAPSALTDGKAIEKVNRVSELLAALPVRPELRYDAELAEALALSTAALEIAALADNEAESALRNAGTAQREARAKFDAAYRSLLRGTRELLGNEMVVRVFPRFIHTAVASEEAEPASGAVTG